MRYARNGTVQFEINSELSKNIKLLIGTAQGDPKPSFGFNASSAPPIECGDFNFFSQIFFGKNVCASLTDRSMMV